MNMPNESTDQAFDEHDNILKHLAFNFWAIAALKYPDNSDWGSEPDYNSKILEICELVCVSCYQLTTLHASTGFTLAPLQNDILDGQSENDDGRDSFEKVSEDLSKALKQQACKNKHQFGEIHEQLEGDLTVIAALLAGLTLAFDAITQRRAQASIHLYEAMKTTLKKDDGWKNKSLLADDDPRQLLQLHAELTRFSRKFVEARQQRHTTHEQKSEWGGYEVRFNKIFPNTDEPQDVSHQGPAGTLFYRRRKGWRSRLAVSLCNGLDITLLRDRELKVYEWIVENVPPYLKEDARDAEIARDEQAVLNAAAVALQLEQARLYYRIADLPREWYDKDRDIGKTYWRIANEPQNAAQSNAENLVGEDNCEEVGSGVDAGRNQKDLQEDVDGIFMNAVSRISAIVDESRFTEPGSWDEVVLRTTHEFYDYLEQERTSRRVSFHKVKTLSKEAAEEADTLVKKVDDVRDRVENASRDSMKNFVEIFGIFLAVAAVGATTIGGAFAANGLRNALLVVGVGVIGVLVFLFVLRLIVSNSSLPRSGWWSLWRARRSLRKKGWEVSRDEKKVIERLKMAGYKVHTGSGTKDKAAADANESAEAS